MLTMSRVLTFIYRYRAANTGDFPRYIELSEEELCDVMCDPAIRTQLCYAIDLKQPETIYGIPVRVVPA